MHISEKSIACILLVLCVFGAYGQIFSLGFTNFDDPGYVTQNPQVQGGLTRQGLIWALGTMDQSNWHPLTWISHMLDCGIYGMNPAGHHFTNLLLHLVSTLLLFQLLHEMTGALRRSAGVAAIFALHPLHVESVVWVSERKDVLSALFWMAATLFYVRYVRNRHRGYYFLMLATFALGLTAKPMLVTLPFVFLLLDYWPLNRWSAAAPEKAVRGGHSSARIAARPWHPAIMILVEKAPMLLLSALSSIVTYTAQRQGGSVMSMRRFPLGDRAANSLISYAGYIRKALWPSDLAVFYPRSGSHNLTDLLLAGGLLACITMIVVRFGRRHPYLASGWLWYLGTLVPVIGLVQVGEQTMADRYTYIPLIGLSIMVVWSAGDISRQLKIGRWALAFTAAATICGMGVLTFVQTGYWKNNLTLFKRAIQVTGDNELAYLNYGASLVASGDLDSAAALYRDFMVRNRGVADIYANLGLIAALQNNKVEAVQQFQAALKLEPDHPEAHNGIGVELAALGRLPEAKEHYLAALGLRRQFPEARYNLGNLFYAEGNLEPAMEQFREAIKLRPLYPEANERLALILVGAGKLEEALPFYAAAVRARPDNPDFHYHFGIALLRGHKLTESITQLQEAIRLKPDWPDALNDLAWILAAAPDGTERDADEAVALAERAIELRGNPDPVIFDTLAEAYASKGRFDDAVKIEEKAEALALASGDQALAREIEMRSQLFKSGHPYRETSH